ncbi:hypothetical protein [Mycoplasma todarodis]|uniref:hypothetical protein n=1 Tax=Mycoplasma todarodis TaxID=1937191 RepID=UPI003B39990A
MIEKIKSKHKLNQWFYFIPILGTIIYSVIVEYAINGFALDGYKQFKVIKKYKTIFALISLVISAIFLTLFFTLRNKHGYGSYPWFFWVGLAFGLSQNLVPVIPWFLYKKGIEDFDKKYPEGIEIIEKVIEPEKAKIKEKKEDTK